MAYRKVDSDIVRRVRAIIPEHKRVMTEKPDLAGYSFDGSFGTYMPELVVQPKSTAEVAAIVKLAYEETIPVYPRGQSTSLSGGPLPVEGGIVLDLSRWDEKLEIYPEDLIAVVSPGVLTSSIHAAAEKAGLMYRPTRAAPPFRPSAATWPRIPGARAA